MVVCYKRQVGLLVIVDVKPKALFNLLLDEIVNRTWIQKQGDFFVESPIVLFAAIIWYLKIYENGRYCMWECSGSSKLMT